MAAAGAQVQNELRDDSWPPWVSCPYLLGKRMSSPLLLLRTITLSPLSQSLQHGGATGDVQLSPAHHSILLELSEEGWPRGCLSSPPGCEMVLQAHIKVMNLHGCHSAAIVDSCFNYYFGKYCRRISKESPSPF